MKTKNEKHTKRKIKNTNKIQRMQKTKRFYDRNKKLVKFYLNFIQRDHNI